LTRERLICVSLLLLQGCVSLQSFPTLARSGDTITLAVGSAEGMTKASTSLTYTPDSTGVPIPIPASSLRAIVPIYPDKRTTAWVNSEAVFIDQTTGHGAWLTVLVIDLPVLPVGTGFINIQTTATYPINASNVNNESILLEVLPGSGSPATFSHKTYADASPTNGVLSDVEVLPHYLIKPDFVFPSPWPTYGAIEIKVIGTLTGGTEFAYRNSMRIVLDESNTSLQSHTQMDWVRNGDTITINIISPTGLLDYYQARASLLFTRSNFIYSSPPIVTVKYFDINGLEVAGPVIKATYVTN